MKASGNMASDESDLFKALMAVQDAPLADQLAVVNSSVPFAAVWSNSELGRMIVLTFSLYLTQI